MNGSRRHNFQSPCHCSDGWLVADSRHNCQHTAIRHLLKHCHVTQSHNRTLTHINKYNLTLTPCKQKVMMSPFSTSSSTSSLSVSLVLGVIVIVSAVVVVVFV